MTVSPLSAQYSNSGSGKIISLHYIHSGKLYKVSDDPTYTGIKGIQEQDLIVPWASLCPSGTQTAQLLANDIFAHANKIKSTITLPLYGTYRKLAGLYQTALYPFFHCICTIFLCIKEKTFLCIKER